MLWGAQRTCVHGPRSERGSPWAMVLRKTYGWEKMWVCVDFLFDQGFLFKRCREAKGLRQFTVGPAIPGSLDAGPWPTGGNSPVLPLILRGAAHRSGAVCRVVEYPQPMRSIGAIYSEECARRILRSRDSTQLLT